MSDSKIIVMFDGQDKLELLEKLAGQPLDARDEQNKVRPIGWFIDDTENATDSVFLLYSLIVQQHLLIENHFSFLPGGKHPCFEHKFYDNKDITLVYTRINSCGFFNISYGNYRIQVEDILKLIDNY